MRRSVFAMIASVCLTTPVWAGETYDLLFRNGTLDTIASGSDIAYLRELSGQVSDATQLSGETALRLEMLSDGQARLFRQAEDREVAELTTDASVGNPMAMYFLETTARQLAQVTGGSPFYLRNRLKEALLEDRPTTDTRIDFADQSLPATVVTLVPFQNDKNRQRMGPIADLVVTVTMSDQVPGWYVSFVAEAPGGAGGTAFYADRLSILGEQE